MSSCSDVELSKCRVVEMSNCRVVEMSSCPGRTLNRLPAGSKHHHHHSLVRSDSQEGRPCINFLLSHRKTLRPTNMVFDRIDFLYIYGTKFTSRVLARLAHLF